MKVRKLLLIALTILAGYFIGTFYCGWTHLAEPVPHHMVGKVVNIPVGCSAEQAVKILSADGLIRDPNILKIYLKVKHINPIVKAGDYLFASPVSAIDVLKQLEEGGNAANKLTIVEGWTRWDIANAMSAIKGLKLPTAAQALPYIINPAPIQDLDKTASSLEGYMFPDTYLVQSDTTPEKLVAATVKRFHEVWDQHLKQRAIATKQSVHDVVIIASIIETEAKLAEERPIVASVIYNRLKQGIPLSVDSTIVYASKLAGKWRNDGKVYLSDVNRDSPYNTRKVTGLPPGPVSCPGLPSLEAALSPATTPYIYYVRNPARDDGAHNFYADAAGFEKGVAALRDWEKKRDASQKQGTTHHK